VADIKRSKFHTIYPRSDCRTRYPGKGCSGVEPVSLLLCSKSTFMSSMLRLEILTLVILGSGCADSNDDSVKIREDLITCCQKEPHAPSRPICCLCAGDGNAIRTSLKTLRLARPVLITSAYKCLDSLHRPIIDCGLLKGVAVRCLLKCLDTNGEDARNPACEQAAARWEANTNLQHGLTHQPRTLPKSRIAHFSLPSKAMIVPSAQ
jgi:hypothetical protein